MTRGGDGNRGAISNGDMTINRVWRKRVKDTGVLGEVDGGAAVEDPLRGGVREPMFAPIPAAQRRRRCGRREEDPRWRRRSRHR
jgi:hypothetical protein